MDEDAPFPRFVPLRQRTFKNFCGAKIKMSSTVFKVFVALTALCCATADLQCNSSVGMENGEIPHHSIDASSTRNSHYPYLGRLNNQIQRLNETKAVWGAWCAEDSNTNQYIQVDLEYVRNVTGVATQGYSYGTGVSSYKIMYSINGKQWFNYEENNTDKIFKGNDDENTIVRHEFNRRLAARFIRFNPLSWKTMICMRVEVYACKIPQTKVTTTVTTTTGNPTTEKNVVDIRTVEVLSKDFKTTEKGRGDQEPTEIMPTFGDGRINTSGRIICSFPLLFACIGLVLSKILN